MPACPQCGSRLEYVAVFNRFHCPHCLKYVVDMENGLARAGILECPKCGKDLFYVKEYDRHYCFKCKAYPPKDRGGSDRTS